MRGLAITQENLTNQQAVVKNEVRVNVLNRPYGGFPWLDMPQHANSNWYNAHNFYGDLRDLDAATLEDAKKFFDTYYTPGNAVLVVTGDFEPVQTLAWVKKYFADLPTGAPVARPKIAAPVLFLGGRNSPGWFQRSVAEQAGATPGARLQMLDGYDHNAPPEVITPLLIDFFGAAR